MLFNLSYTNTGGIAFIILLIQRNGGIVCHFLFVIFLCRKLLAVAGFTLYNAVTVIGVIVAFHNEIFATALAFTHSNYLTSQFPKFIQNHGCKRMCFHDLRHSCASFLPQTASAPSLFESLFLFCQSKKQALRPAFHFGGELGIRTLGTLRTQHFECCTFDHSDNSPCFSLLRHARLHIATCIIPNISILVNKNKHQIINFLYVLK